MPTISYDTVTRTVALPKAVIRAVRVLVLVLVLALTLLALALLVLSTHVGNVDTGLLSILTPRTPCRARVNSPSSLGVSENT